MTKTLNDIEHIQVTPDEHEPRFLGLKYIIGEVDLKLSAYDSRTEVILSTNTDELHPQLELLYRLHEQPGHMDSRTALLYAENARYAIRDENADCRAAVINKMLMGAWLSAYELLEGKNVSRDLAKRSLDAQRAFHITEAMNANDPQRNIALQCVVDELLLSESVAFGPLSRATNRITLARAKHDLNAEKATNYLAQARASLDLSTSTIDHNAQGMHSDRIIRDTTQKLYDEINYFNCLYQMEISQNSSSHPTAAPIAQRAA